MVHERMYVDEVRILKATASGNSCHVFLPKRWENRDIVVLLLNRFVKELIIYSKTKKRVRGKNWYHAKIWDNQGDAEFWIDKKEIDAIQDMGIEVKWA